MSNKGTVSADLCGLDESQARATHPDPASISLVGTHRQKEVASMRVPLVLSFYGNRRLSTSSTWHKGGGWSWCLAKA